MCSFMIVLCNKYYPHFLHVLLDVIHPIAILDHPEWVWNQYEKSAVGCRCCAFVWNLYSTDFSGSHRPEHISHHVVWVNRFFSSKLKREDLVHILTQNSIAFWTAPPFLGMLVVVVMVVCLWWEERSSRGELLCFALFNFLHVIGCFKMHFSINTWVVWWVFSSTVKLVSSQFWPRAGLSGC